MFSSLEVLHRVLTCEASGGGQRASVEGGEGQYGADLGHHLRAQTLTLGGVIPSLEDAQKGNN